MKVWRAGLGTFVGANLINDWYFEPGLNVTLETFKGKYRLYCTVREVPVVQTILYIFQEDLISQLAG